MSSKAAALAVLWLIAPFWLFTLAALLTYLVPIFRPLSLAVPFVLALGYAYVAAEGVFSAFLVGLLFFFILGIKDFVFIRRVEAYEMLGVLLVMTHAIGYLIRNSVGDSGVVAFVTGALFFAVAESLRIYRDRELHRGALEIRRGRVASTLASLIVAEWIWALTLLPLPAPLQRIALFTAGALLLELMSEEARAPVSRRALLRMGSVFCMIIVLVFTANKWSV